MKMQYLESLQAVVTTEIRIWDPSQPPIQYSVYKVLLAQLAAVCANCKPKSTEDEKQDKFY